MSIDEQPDIRPWHKEPWVWGIIGALGFVVIACIVMLFVSIRGDDGLVKDDHVKDWVEVTKNTARLDKSAALGLGAEISLLPDNTVLVKMRSDDAAFAAKGKVNLVFVHPRFEKEDRTLPLEAMDNLRLTAEMPPLPKGKWLVVLENEEWQLKGEVLAPFEKVVLGRK